VRKTLATKSKTDLEERKVNAHDLKHVLETTPEVLTERSDLEKVLELIRYSPTEEEAGGTDVETVEELVQKVLERRKKFRKFLGTH
jgi:hypothetical protein